MRDLNENNKDIFNKNLIKSFETLINAFAGIKKKSPTSSKNPTPPASPPKTSKSKNKGEIENLNYPFFRTLLFL